MCHLQLTDSPADGYVVCPYLGLAMNKAISKIQMHLIQQACFISPEESSYKRMDYAVHACLTLQKITQAQGWREGSVFKSTGPSTEDPEVPNSHW